MPYRAPRRAQRASTYGRAAALVWKRSTADSTLTRSILRRSAERSPIGATEEFLRQLLDELPEVISRGARAAFHSRLHRGGDRSEQRSLTEHGLEVGCSSASAPLKQKLDHDSELAELLELQP